MKNRVNLRGVESASGSNYGYEEGSSEQTHHSMSSSGMGGISKATVAILAVAMFAIGGLAFGLGPSLMSGKASIMGAGSGNEIQNKDKYKAVFLTNGQVYFGKISKKNDKELYLREIYYLQVSKGLQSGEKEKKDENGKNPELSLIKLGNELHGPEDQMVVNRDQILFTEDLKDDSNVVKAIKDYKK